MPFSDKFVPFGVSHLAIVTFKEVSEVSCTNSCTEPLPNVFMPTSFATPFSFNAPARISEAEAEPLSTRMSIFKFLVKISYPLL